MLLGYLAVGIKHPDYIPLKLINTYLGNGLSSRLFVELREKRGLAYDVSAIYPTRMHHAPFVTYMGTAPENTAIAVAGLHKEAERLVEIRLSDWSFDYLKNTLLVESSSLGKALHIA